MPLTRRSLLAGVALSTITPGPPMAMAQAKITLNVLYSGAYVNKAPIEEISRQFEAMRPDIQIRLESAKGYTEMTQLMLRAAITGSIPDIGFQGLSFVRLFVERELAAPLDTFISSESDWKTLGYSTSVMSLAKKNGGTYGIPFEVSVPTVYVNADLVRKAGGDPDDPPKTWAEIVALGKNINAESGGIYFDYTPTGNWTFIALVQSQGGTMMTPDDKKIQFDGPEGMRALELLKEIGEAGMKNMTRDQAKQAFVAGSIGILITSSSDITLFTEQSAGKFDLRVLPFPVEPQSGSLPAGGNALMIHTRDQQKQQAAWDYIKFATGPIGQTIMATKTSYVPINSLAIEDPKFLGDYYKDRPNLRVPVEQLPIVSGWFSFPGENSLKITKVIEDRLREVLLLQQAPNDAMRQMVDEVSSMLPQG